MENARHEEISGVAVGNPLHGLAPDAALRITANVFKLQEVAGANHGITSLTTFKGALTVLAFRDDREHQTLGSGVLVHPGIAITAKHVVTDWLERLAVGTASAVCQGPSHDHLHLWDVTSCSVVANADIALLTLNYRAALPPGNRFNVYEVTTGMPSVGDRVFLAGFTAPGDGVIPKTSKMRTEGMMRIGVGTVTDVWKDGRDRVMLPSASFAVDCPSFGGMSGGPVFDSAGRVVGIVSTGEGPVACVSHIWPALIAHTSMAWPYSVPNTSLLHLGSRHGITIYRPDAFITDVVDGGFTLTYQPRA